MKKNIATMPARLAKEKATTVIEGEEIGKLSHLPAKRRKCTIKSNLRLCQVGRQILHLVLGFQAPPDVHRTSYEGITA